MTGAQLKETSAPQRAGHTVEIEHETVVALRREAAGCDILVGRLINDLLNVIATDKLTTAILDD